MLLPMLQVRWMYFTVKKMAEVQDILHEYGDAFLTSHKVSHEQKKVMTALSECRTASMGAHKIICEECGHTEISYNSCRNRHCPKCQTFSKEKWIDKQKLCLLPVGYFHIVFTIPDTLNPVAFQNQRTVYNLMFKAAWETLRDLSSDRKYLGAEIGVTSVLHTWGQQLVYHPHIHCIVSGGGITKDGKWKHSRKKFFLPMRVMAKLFRGKLLAYLREAKLEFFNDSAYLNDPVSFDRLLRSCYEKEWIVYSKPPFRSAETVVEYLGRYTHRVAISNNRIIAVQDGKVTFSWKDYRDGNRRKVMTLTADEFIRRFLLHVLPKGFNKIRHFGYLGSRYRAVKLGVCRKSLKVKTVCRLKTTEEILQGMGIHPYCSCPVCGSEKLHHSYTTRMNN